MIWSLIIAVWVSSFCMSLVGSQGVLAAVPPGQQSASAKSPDAMTNADVIEMVRLGLSDDIIIAKIRTEKVTGFDSSVAGLKALKAAQVSNAVIRVMINPATTDTSQDTAGRQSSSGDRAPSQTPTYTTQAPDPITADDFTFTLKECVHGINTYIGETKVLNCYGLAENRSDRTLHIKFTEASLVDNLGNQFSVSLGSMYLGAPGILVLGETSGNLSQDLAPNLPIKFGFQVQRWSENATAFNFILKFTTAKDVWGSEIVFRNIPIRR